jgi:hypothetical protein
MATGGDPNGPVARNAVAVPPWLAVSPDTGGGGGGASSLDGLAYMSMKQGPEVLFGLEDGSCDFWDTFLGF